MKAFAVTLIVVGALALFAVLSLGIFFAVRPRQKTTNYVFGAPKTAEIFGNNVDGIERAHTLPPSETPSPSESRPTVPAPVRKGNRQGNTIDDGVFMMNAPSAFVGPPSAQAPAPPPPVRTVSAGSSTSLIINRRRPSPSTRHPPAAPPGIEAAKPVRIITAHGARQQGSMIVGSDTEHDSTQAPTATTAPPRDLEGTPMRLISETRDLALGKIVGLALGPDNRLYVPSHRAGRIAVMDLTPDAMQIVRTVPCTKCSIYDIAVLPGDNNIVIVQGSKKVITIINGTTGDELKRIDVQYATKGVIVDEDGRVLVLSRSHDTIYRYDVNLNPIDTVTFPNNEQDCNFLTAANGRIVVGCENVAYMLRPDGHVLHRLKPPEFQATYSVGLSFDNQANKLYVCRRGYSQLDVYDAMTGEYNTTLGRHQPTLWSDLVIHDNRAYVVDYMSASVRQYALP